MKGGDLIARKGYGHQNNREVGTLYEHRAAEYLKKEGYELICCNFRCRLGEIDLIAREGDTLVFVEVKYRSRTEYGAPSDAVNHKKQERISNAASYYVYKNFGNTPVSCRFDVISIQNNEITLYRNAFSYAGKYS